MTDYSKIDFTQLKLDNIQTDRVHVSATETSQVNLHLSGRVILYKRYGDSWRFTDWTSSLTRTEVRELLLRSDQVDAFIEQQSRRRITVLQLVRELVNRGGQAITIDIGGSLLMYRLNLASCTIEYQIVGCDDWVFSDNIGRHDDIVTVID